MLLLCLVLVVAGYCWLLCVGVVVDVVIVIVVGVVVVCWLLVVGCCYLFVV